MEQENKPPYGLRKKSLTFEEFFERQFSSDITVELEDDNDDESGDNNHVDTAWDPVLGDYNLSRYNHEYEDYEEDI